MNILVTGGAGYIGSHTCLALLEAGYGVVVADNLSNSSEESLARVMALTGKSLAFYRADIGDGARHGQNFQRKRYRRGYPFCWTESRGRIGSHTPRLL